LALTRPQKIAPVSEQLAAMGKDAEVAELDDRRQVRLANHKRQL
jgi:hypothetical protein